MLGRPEAGEELAHGVDVARVQHHRRVQLAQLKARPEQRQGEQGEQQPGQGGGVAWDGVQHRGMCSTGAGTTGELGALPRNCSLA
ncbi:hypothetical protein D9M71_648660 [compost metagenome]